MLEVIVVGCKLTSVVCRQVLETVYSRSREVAPYRLLLEDDHVGRRFEHPSDEVQAFEQQQWPQVVEKFLFRVTVWD